MISILNYGLGNLASIQNMLKKVGAESRIISTVQDVQRADALIVPGVGKIDFAIRQLDELGLRQALNEAAFVRKIPILGICLGMQLMTHGSEEGSLPTLGWINARTVRIDGARHNVRVPHMGWNLICLRKSDPIFEGDGFAEHRFYFVHSYVVKCSDPADVLASTHYGGEFVSAFARGNLMGVQFHPEKSHKFGASFLRRFAAVHCRA